MRDSLNNKRIQINVPEELKVRHDRIFAWGEWNRVGVQVIEWMCDMHEQYGDAAFLIFRSGKLGQFLQKELGNGDYQRPPQ